MNNDLISREALRNVILNDRKLDGANANWEVNRILVHIENAPTVEVFTEEYVSGAYNEGYMCGSREAEKARPKGEWIKIDAFVVKCSVCGVESFETPFCPRCGADMRKGGAE